MGTRIKRRRAFKSNVRALLNRKMEEENRTIWTPEVAQALGVSRWTVTRWIRSEIIEIDADTLLKFMAYFDCPMEAVVSLPSAPALETGAVEPVTA